MNLKQEKIIRPPNHVMKGKPHLKGISLRQRRWVKEYLSHGNGTQAAMDTYNPSSRHYARRISTANINSPLVKTYMARFLDEAGLKDDQIADHLKKIITAGTSNRALSQAKVSDSLRGLDMINRLKDNFPVEKRVTQNQNLNVSLAGKSNEDLQTMLANLAKELQEFQTMTKKVAKITEAEVIDDGKT